MKKQERVFTDFPTAEQLKTELRERKRQKKFLRVVGSTVFMLAVVAAVAVLISTVWLSVLKIYGSSMEPTLNAGEMIVAVKTQNIHRGDVVAFYFGNKLMVKRCIAVGGDSVNIDDSGKVYVNGDLLNEPYVQELALGECDVTFPREIPDGKYFLLGDNRGDSIDSRNASIGCIDSEFIVGKVFFRLWPISHIKTIHS